MANTYTQIYIQVDISLLRSFGQVELPDRYQHFIPTGFEN